MTGVDARSVHLLAQTMEAWIVADADALSRYYGPGFNARALSRAADLENVAKGRTSSRAACVPPSG